MSVVAYGMGLGAGVVLGTCVNTLGIVAGTKFIEYSGLRGYREVRTLAHRAANLLAGCFVVSHLSSSEFDVGMSTGSTLTTIFWETLFRGVPHAGDQPGFKKFVATVLAGGAVAHLSATLHPVAGVFLGSATSSFLTAPHTLRITALVITGSYPL